MDLSYIGPQTQPKPIRLHADSFILSLARSVHPLIHRPASVYVHTSVVPESVNSTLNQLKYLINPRLPLTLRVTNASSEWAISLFN